MNIVQVNYLDNVGGAARIAWLLHQDFKSAGHNAWMVVGQKNSQDDQIIQIPDAPSSVVQKYLYRQLLVAEKRSSRFLLWTVGGILRRMVFPKRYFNHICGVENFNFPNSRKILSLLSSQPDIVHLHNLHRDYFDLSYLPILSSTVPTFITLHDTWLLSGHCAYSLDCEKWRIGCGQCPYLGSYPAVQRDKTHFNWRRKRGIYSHSRLYVVAPSRWILEKANESILKPAIVESRVIYNGVDQSIFCPGNKKEARHKLGISEDDIVLLFVADGGKDNPYKDFETIWKAVQKIKASELKKKILLLVLGQNAGRLVQENKYGEMVRVQYVPYQTSLSEVANYYRVADIYLQASRADNFPNVILEALACGTPVIATSVGGISEQIIDGQTGYLVKPGDWTEMAEKTMRLILDDQLRVRMGKQAVEDSGKRFQARQMVNSYIDWYNEIIDKNSRGRR